jgi:hypothetical protein
LIIGIFYLLSTSKKTSEKNTALSVHDQSPVSITNPTAAINEIHPVSKNANNHSTSIKSEKNTKINSTPSLISSGTPIKSETSQSSQADISEKIKSNLKNQSSSADLSNTPLKNNLSDKVNSPTASVKSN